MIVYYRDSDGFTLSVRSDDAKSHLDDTALQAECDAMYPLETPGDVRAQRITGDNDVTPGGTWDPTTETMTSPPVPTPKPVHPDKDRIKAIFDKMATGSATLAEVQEYLSKSDLTKNITATVTP
jgi:hypothetical protein